jgi:cytosine deaminase
MSTTMRAGAQPLEISAARVPASLIDADGLAADHEGLVTVDLDLIDGRVAAIRPAGSQSFAGHDADFGILMPAFVDVHTHIDKGHIWPRSRNVDGTFDSALAQTGADREAHWSAEDVRARMSFSLRCAEAHGTMALRTHLDSIGKQVDVSWGVFAEIRADWRDRIALQATALFGIDYARDDAAFTHLADTVKRVGGQMGGVAYMVPDLPDLLDRVVRAAADRGLDLDLHVDETQDPGALGLEAVADAVLRNGFSGKVLCGHCCSLARQPAETQDRVIAKVAKTGIAIVSLPLCNLYLQDRRPPGATPIHRGVTLLHELAAAGVPVMVSSDNTRDPFYAYGDLDALEVWREAVRIAHLDHPFGAWPSAIARTPAAVMRLPDAGVIRVGAPANLVLFRARSFTELLARPQHDRAVLRRGVVIARDLPDYRELDAVVGSPIR